MGCAAFGNLASVIVGVLMGERVEKLAMKLGDDCLTWLFSCLQFCCDDCWIILLWPFQTLFVNFRSATTWIIIDATWAFFGQSCKNSRVSYRCNCGLCHRHASLVLDRPSGGERQAAFVAHRNLKDSGVLLVIRIKCYVLLLKQYIKIWGKEKVMSKFYDEVLHGFRAFSVKNCT